MFGQIIMLQMRYFFVDHSNADIWQLLDGMFRMTNFDDELDSKTIVVSTSSLSTGPNFVVFERNKGNRRDSDGQQNSTEKAPAIEFASTSSRWIRRCSRGCRFLS